MEKLNQLIDQIANDIIQSKHNQFSKEQEKDERLLPGSTQTIIAYNLPIYSYIDHLKNNFKDLDIDSFFANSNLTINSALEKFIAASLVKEQTKYLLLKERIIELIKKLLHDIKEMKSTYSITFRIMNISLSKEIVFEEDGTQKICLQTIDESLVNSKYPQHKLFYKSLPTEDWVKHNTEFVILKKGTPKDIENDSNVEGMDVLENVLINSFILSDIEPVPYATHAVLNSLFNNSLNVLKLGNLKFVPEIISEEQGKELVRAYKTIRIINHDIILERAFDRFIIACKKENQNPNKINTQNWDKIVDFTIAFETLFLTANGSDPDKRELSYRFKLNGSSLLSNVIDKKQKDIFNSLGKLYSIRSNIVHGGKEKDLAKLTDEFIKILNEDDPNYKHPIGKLILISNILKSWLQSIFNYLAELEHKERPYRKAGAWEDYLFTNGLDLAYLQAMQDVKEGNAKTQTAKEHIKEIMDEL